MIHTYEGGFVDDGVCDGTMCDPCNTECPHSRESVADRERQAKEHEEATK